MATQFIRLFPLQSVVLFPGMELSLTVFEPRYLQLARECVESSEPFGVLLLRQGREAGDPDAEPHDVGTFARIDNLAALGDGRLSVRATGEGRFRVAAFSRKLPYLSAEVELIEELGEGDVDSALTERTSERAGNVVRALMSRRGGWLRDVPMPDEPVALSYAVAQMFQGDPATQQHLLELPTITERLEREFALLSDVLDQVTSAPRRDTNQRGFSPN